MKQAPAQNTASSLRLVPFLVLGLCGCSSEMKNSGPSHPETYSRSAFLMGTPLDVELETQSTPPDQAWNAIEQVFSRIRQIEARLSTWKPDSELSRFNSKPVGEKFEPSLELRTELDEVIKESKDTEAFFSPFLAPLVRAWGLRTGGRLPSVNEQNRALRASQKDAIQITPSSWVKMNAEAGIEEGGFGKGLALDQARGELRTQGFQEFRLNFGGQVLLEGNKPQPIVISDPTDRSQAVLQFELKSGSVSTSGNSEHGLRVKSGSRTLLLGHILDPKSGAPARDVGSVTAIEKTGLRAEILSKGFVLGPKKGLKWANDHARAILFLSRDRGSRAQFTARMSCAFPEVQPLNHFKIKIIRNCPGEHLKKEKP
jgi:thiamine biosynthesis lipoprotein